MNSARSVVSGGIAETSGGGAGAELRLDDAPGLFDDGSPKGTSRWTPTSDMPSSET